MLPVFNGSAKVIKDLGHTVGPVTMDSSFSGFGGTWETDWFLGVWDPGPILKDSVPDHRWAASPDQYSPDMNINILELWPMLVSAARWGHHWSGFKIKLITDNTQVMHMINTGRSASIQCMQWIRELFWLSFVYNFHVVATHIASVDNIIPDFLSRYYDPKNTSIPPAILTNHFCCFQQWIPYTSRFNTIKATG